MRFAILSTLALVGAAVASTDMQNVKREQPCVGDLLCCGELKTPLDPAVDPILLELDINATSIVGSIGLDCTKSPLHTYETKANELSQALPTPRTPATTVPSAALRPTFW